MFSFRFFLSHSNVLNLVSVVCVYSHCLLLLQNGAHHTVEDFSTRGKEPKGEVQIYTWRDATLRELTDLVSAHAADALILSSSINVGVY